MGSISGAYPPPSYNSIYPPPSYDSLYGTGGTPASGDVNLGTAASSGHGAAPAAEEPKSKGGFFQGIWDGFKHAVSSLFTPQGFLMAAAGLAACIAFPVAAPLILGGMAVGAGGYMMYKGATTNDSHKAGEGFFTAAMGGLGMWGGAKAIGTGEAKTPPAAADGAASDTAALASRDASEVSGVASKDTTKYRNNFLQLWRPKRPAGNVSGGSASGDITTTIPSVGELNTGIQGHKTSLVQAQGDLKAAQVKLADAQYRNPQVQPGYSWNPWGRSAEDAAIANASNTKGNQAINTALSDVSAARAKVTSLQEGIATKQGQLKTAAELQQNVQNKTLAVEQAAKNVDYVSKPGWFYNSKPATIDQAKAQHAAALRELDQAKAVQQGKTTPQVETNVSPISTSESNVSAAEATGAGQKLTWGQQARQQRHDVATRFRDFGGNIKYYGYNKNPEAGTPTKMWNGTLETANQLRRPAWSLASTGPLAGFGMPEQQA